MNSKMGYVSVLFALMVADYLVAPHFNLVMSGIVAGVFIIFSAIMMMAVKRGLAARSGLANEIFS